MAFAASLIGKVWLYGILASLVSGACIDEFVEIIGPTAGQSSDCQDLGNEVGHTVESCANLTCNRGGNVFNLMGGYCAVRECYNDKLFLTDRYGGWAIYGIPDLYMSAPVSPKEFDHSVAQCMAGGFPVHHSNQTVDTSQLYLLVEYEFSCAGGLASWVFYGEREGNFSACVFRPDRKENVIRSVGCNKLSSEGKIGQAYEVGLSGRIPVQPGDIIGILFSHEQEGQAVSVHTAAMHSEVSGMIKTKILRVPDTFYWDFDGTWVADFPATFVNYEEDWSFAIAALVVGLPVNLRLTDGTEDRKGRAELLKNGVWGTICDKWFHYFGWPNLFCKSVGYPTSERVYYAREVPNASLPLTMPIHEMSPRCKPSRNMSIFACDLHPHGDCTHYEDLYVECQRRVKMLGSNNRCKGVPAIWDNHYWGTICDNTLPTDHYPATSWTSAFCKELGCGDWARLIAIAEKYISNYTPLMQPSYPSPECNVDWPSNMRECPKQLNRGCNNTKDYYLECVEA